MGLNGGSLRVKRVCRGIRRFGLWSSSLSLEHKRDGKTKVLPGPLL